MERELETTLDLTYEALLSGDLLALEKLGDTLLRATDALAGLGPEAAERLRRKADRNGRMLMAAASGLRMARGRFVEISMAPMLSIYNARGRKESLSPVSTIPSRRL